jgi:dihydrofolate reductase
MRKIVAGFASSLDGYIEGMSGEYDWIIIDPEVDFPAQMKRYDAFLCGRRTYEAMLRMNPKPTPGVKNYVYSTTLEKVHEAFELVKEDTEQQIRKLKSEEGKDIALFGGASLLASLLDLKLVEEISVAVIPVLLGSGKPMVEVLKEKVWLELTGTKTYSNGTIRLNYNVRYTKPKRNK